MIVSIIVVLYDKEAEDSASLQSLVNLLSNVFFFDKVNILVFNNGPSIISLESIQELCKEITKKNVFLFLEQDVTNKPLSLVYNDFIEKFRSSDKYILLDDDSVLPAEFFKCISKHEDFDLILPLIESDYDEKIYYPIINGQIFFEESTEFKKKPYPLIINSISSGLIFSAKLASCLKNVYGSVFDKNYALYGVDSSFFLRLNKINKKRMAFKIMSGNKISHSLSRASKKISHDNMRERIIDMGISLRHYPSIKALCHILKMLFVHIINGRFSLVLTFFCTLLYGCHPRCK